jgi:hypothetical protein
MSRKPGVTRNILFRTAIFILLATLTGPSLVTAQTTGAITGKVTDESGGVLSGAKVAARHTETGMSRSTTTGADGRFLLAGLPVGDYEVRAQYQGFRMLVRSGISVVVNETLVLDCVLQVGALEQEVVVVGQSTPVNLQSHELSYLVAERSIRELPLNGRNYTDLALLQPGVVAFPHRDGGSVVAHGLGTSINGQDPRSNVYLLDGTPQNDFTNGPAGSAAGTALGVETIREFRVEANAYSAEFGRNSGGQINALTKSGTNLFSGSLYWFHRNDNMDARNYFDPARKPEFKRNQFGGTLGGPIAADRTFFFLGYESLRERLGRTISTVVPDANARNGVLPTETVVVNATVRPYLDEFPLPNGPNLGQGLAQFTFPFKQVLDQNFGQLRIDHNFTANLQFFSRYTYDGAEQLLPTDFPQFPRSFLSRNQFFTSELRWVQSATLLHTFRFNFSRTRVGQDVEANTSQPLQPFVPGRELMGSIDIGGIPRFGTQSSVNVQLTQNLFGFEYGGTAVRGRHLLKFGGMGERYQDNLYNPTFSLGIYTFASLRAFLLGTPLRFIGLTPDGELDRYWRFTLFGFYAQDTWRVLPRLTLNAGLRYEFASMPREIYDRDSALIRMSDPREIVGPLYQNPTLKNISPRIGLAWDVFGNGRTSVRSGYGWYFNTNNQQNLIVTITNPPYTPRVVTPNPAFPQPNFAVLGIPSIRPVQYDLKNPNLHVWNLSVQQQTWWDVVVTVGYAGTRGVHLLRSADVNIPAPQQLSDGTFFWPAGQTRPNTNFTTIELKSSDGNSWYNALIIEVRKRWSRGVQVQSSYTFSRNIDTTQASTFFSDATNGTTSAFPDFPGLEYNKGLADFHAKHNWVMNVVWALPFGRNLEGAAKTMFDGWEVAVISNVRSGGPLTAFVQSNRSRSLWSPSLGPGIGFDRPNIAPGFTHESAVLGRPDQYFNPAAFQLQPVGRLGNLGRGALIGPKLRTLDFALVKNTAFSAWGRERTVQFRAEAFNLLNRANFGTPALTAFVGAPANTTEPVLSSFGRIRSTVTSSRQIQLGMRLLF